ncbi:PUA-like domain-containing protein [Hypoxylon sp. FL1284]|nr:PUA-like domain-containing protein [Hypoxylon sp. FL1284]
MFERIARYNEGTRPRLDVPQLHVKSKRISDGGGDRSLFSRQREFMNQILSPVVGHFGYDGTGSLSSSRSPSKDTLPVPPSSPDKQLDWDREALLELSDSIRASLRQDKTLGPDAQKLSEFLDAAWRHEDRRKRPALDLATIEYARLDKLLAEVLEFAEALKNCTDAGASRGSAVLDAPPLRFRVDVLNCESLGRIWRRRFRDRYFMIDQNRREALMTGGRLTEASFGDPLASGGGGARTKASDPISELEGNLQFEAGDWWLNIACARHDGIVNSSFETPTKGRYGITALPLLTGQEDIVGSNTYRYIREGKATDMHIPLISQVGRQIRVLRGYQLKSLLAPHAGVRYDGLFTIKQYGSKLDSRTGAYRLELVLERVAGQKRPLDELARQVPRPSQLDDWHAFTRLEGDRIKTLHGEAAYLWWVIRLHEDKADRDEWKRAQLFRASFS